MRTLSVSSVLYFTLCNNYTLTIKVFYKYYYNYVFLEKTTVFKGLFSVIRDIKCLQVTTSTYKHLVDRLQIKYDYKKILKVINKLTIK